MMTDSSANSKHVRKLDRNHFTVASNVLNLSRPHLFDTGWTATRLVSKQFVSSASTKWSLFCLSLISNNLQLITHSNTSNSNDYIPTNTRLRSIKFSFTFYFRVAPFLEHVGCTTKVYGSSKKRYDQRIICSSNFNHREIAFNTN